MHNNMNDIFYLAENMFLFKDDIYYLGNDILSL